MVADVRVSCVSLGSGNIGTGRYTYRSIKTNKAIKREFVYKTAEEKKEFHRKMGTTLQIIVSSDEARELGL